jgi:hypothetical protein
MLSLADEIIHELQVATYQNTLNTDESFIEKRIDGIFVRQKCFDPGRYIIFLKSKFNR